MFKRLFSSAIARLPRSCLTAALYRSMLYDLSSKRKMATVREDSIPHIVRTAHEQRLAGSWNAVISSIEQVNSMIRLIRLALANEPVGLHELPYFSMSNMYTWR
jgi:hypothetical protein